MKQDDRSTQGKKAANPQGEISSKAPRAKTQDKDQGQQQAIARNLGRVNDQGREGKERRTSSPHNR